MSLSDLQYKSAKPKDKAYKLTDGKGLFLLVTPSGGKWWRFNYLFEHKHKTLSMGTYLETGLREA